MIIYGALLIPLIVAIVLYIFYSHSTVWWEFFIPLAASLLMILIMKGIIEVSQVSSKEYWGSMVDRVEYYEAWDEEVPCRHPVYCEGTRTNSKGEEETYEYECGHEHLYDVDYHYPYWQIVTTINETIGVDQNEYLRLKSKFNNNTFVELNRDYHSIDGNKYYSKWMGDTASATPVTTLHHYENRIKVADQSVFHFGKVTPEDIKRYDIKEYPQITDRYKMVSVIGDNSQDAILADKQIQYINGLLGPRKQVKIFVLIFKNQPIEAGLYQEWYWSGGNKNEFVVCIGIDNQRNVKWCKPISWTTSEILKVRVKSFVQDQSKLNLQALAGYLKPQINKDFVKRSFKEFDYLTVEPPTWAIILTYLLTIGLNIGLSAWIISNEYEEQNT